MLKRRIVWVFSNSLWLGSLGFGLYYDIGGLTNIGLFLTWLSIICMSVSMSDEVIEKMAEKGGFAFPLWVEHTTNIIAGSILIWYGHIITAIFLAISALVITHAYVAVEYMLDELSNEDEPAEATSAES
jgi:hypothetical protein